MKRIAGRILDLCSHAGRPVKIMPYLSQLLFQKDIIPQIQDIRIEDLLGREPAKFDREKVAGFLKDKVCMITGRVAVRLGRKLSGRL